jgi:hypothetical protein
MTERQRATSIEEMRERMGAVFTDETLEAGLAFEPDPSDVVISPYGKCGTTWLQQIVHGLRTDGDVDFDDISRVVPWIETAAVLGIDLDAPQRALPRAYKSHLPWEMVPKGGRYIVSFRDPKDALVSFHRFMEGWTLEPGSVAIEEVAEVRYFAGSDEDYWSHFLGWWAQRDNPDVLLLTFESMKRDLSTTVRRVAEFIGIDGEKSISVATQQASFDFMAAHKDRFDDAMMRSLLEQMADMPMGGDSAKVRAGDVGSHRAELSDELRAKIDAMWMSTIGDACGLGSYEEVIEILG